MERPQVLVVLTRSDAVRQLVALAGPAEPSDGFRAYGATRVDNGLRVATSAAAPEQWLAEWVCEPAAPRWVRVGGAGPADLAAVRTLWQTGTDRSNGLQVRALRVEAGQGWSASLGVDDHNDLQRLFPAAAVS